MGKRLRIKEKFVNALELPRELILNVPKITLGKGKILSMLQAVTTRRMREIKRRWGLSLYGRV